MRMIIKKAKRRRFIGVWLTEPEFRDFVKMCKKNGFDKSEQLRELIYKELDK